MVEVVIGIGSNVGDRLRFIQEALGRLNGILSEPRRSSVVESPAHLLPGSPPEWNLPFLNCAVAGFTFLSPRELLHALKRIEAEMGAVKTARWAPRKIDLDILVYGEQTIEEPELTIPHKELLHRPFALFPLAQLLPYWRSPSGQTALELTHLSPFRFDRTLLASPSLVGILNVTPDSFSDGGLYVEAERAALHAENLLRAGASFIDVGAASTRPGAKRVSPEEEWGRLAPVLTALHALLKEPRISIDTYHEAVALRAIAEFDVDMINFEGPHIGQGLARSGKKIVCMHSLLIPADRSKVLPFDEDPLPALIAWGEEKVQELGEQAILDPGIGFGKTAAQSLMILRRIEELKAVGAPLLVGHSRKSFMNLFSSKRPEERDGESAAISLHLMRAGVDYLRVHDVQTHMELLVAHQALSVGETYALA